MPIAQLLELWKKIEVEPMETEAAEEEDVSLDTEPPTEDTAEESKGHAAPPETQPAAPVEKILNNQEEDS